MARAHLYRPLQDAAGNLQRGATVRLFEPNTTNEILESLYVDDTGSATYSQPIACPNGYLSVYFDRRKRVDIAVTAYNGANPTIFPDVDVIGALVTAADVAITPIQNLTSGDTQSALDEINTALRAHLPGTDPHPQYLTQAEADARYGLGTPFSSKTANYTLTATDGIVFFTGTNLTAALPTPASIAGRQYTIKNLDTSNLTISTAAGLIDGQSTLILAQYDTATLCSDGTNWGII